MSTREMAASVLAGMVHCVLGSVLAGLLSSGLLITVVLLLA